MYNVNTELTGILMPGLRNVVGQPFSFKLGTDSCDYHLKMSEALAGAAKAALWEEVTVKGCLNLDTKIIEVERLILAEPEEAFPTAASFKEPFDLDVYTRTIGKLGKLEPDASYLAS